MSDIIMYILCLPVCTEEGHPGESLRVSMPVQRDRGTFGRVTVSWSVSPVGQVDLVPPAGVLVFEEGQDEKNISLTVVNERVSLSQISTLTLTQTSVLLSSTRG